jgi:peptide/nickel transport system substrate-binding protein
MTILYDRLLQYTNKAGADPFNNPIIPSLAESWSISDDFLTYTFRLRKGVKFQNLPPVNGREMDAEDIKATVALYKAPASVTKPFYESVDSVEVIDRYTVAFHMKQVEPTMLNTLSESIRGSILPREQTHPASLVRRPGGIGTGPFMAAGPYEYKVGITYKRNPDYWLFDDGNRLPYLDGFRVVVIPDQSARLTAFRTGKIDTGFGVVSGGVEPMRRLMGTNPTTLLQEYVFTTGGGCYPCFRLDVEPWKDVRVRRAMSLAINYDTIAQTVFGVPPLLVASLVAGLWYGADDSLKTTTEVCGCPWYSYDPQRAKQLLAEAGFPKGFSTTLAFFPYDQSNIEWMELSAAYWKAIGVDAKIFSQDYTVYRANVDKGNWENLGRSFMCCGSTSIYASMGALTPGGPKNPQQGFINDPKITALAKEISASYRDEAKQRELLGQLWPYYLDQVFTTPQVSGTGKTVFAPRLRNFTTTNKIPGVHDTRGWMWTWIDDDWSFAK